MFVLEINNLMPGDIVLTAQDEFVSRKIRKITGGDFSHGILYVGGGSYIHSDVDGVHAHNTQRLHFKKSSQVQAYRLLERDEEIVRHVCAFARSEIGKQHSIPEAIRSKIRCHSTESAALNRQFCSRLVGQAYAYAGIHLVQNPNFCYPKDVGDSSLLYRVQSCVREASEEETKIASTISPLEIQARTTNLILAEARRLSGRDIQTFDQLIAYLLEDDQHDKAITEFVRKSGYLDFWKCDVMNNRWRYNLDIFIALPISEEERCKLAQKELAASEEQLSRFLRQYGQYTSLYQRAKRHYFAQEQKLYIELIEWANKRAKVARNVIANA